MPGSCSRGLRSRPWAAAGSRRSKGFEVNSRNSRKPTETRPRTPRMRARNTDESVREKAATAHVQPESISDQSSIEPSCEPQLAATRSSVGRSVFEWLATSATEKSLLTKAAIRVAKAITMATNCAIAAGCATAIRRASCRCAPTSGRTPSASPRASATARAKCPSSTLMGSFSWVLRLRSSARAHRMAGALEGVGRFGRHVVLVVLGEHLGRGKAAVVVEPSLRDDAAAFLEEVGQDAGVADQDGVVAVRDPEGPADAVAGALETAGLDQPADPEVALGGRLALGHLRRRDEPGHVAAERIEDQRGSDADRDEASGNPGKSSVAWFQLHVASSAKLASSPVCATSSRARR